MTKEPPILYRKRFIPEETVCLRSDVVLHFDDNLIITSWNVLHPRNDFSRGYSCCFLDKGFRVSRLIKPDGELLYWYCDIMDFVFGDEGKKLVMTDLLADIVVYPDGRTRLLDLDELAEAHARGLIDSRALERCLVRVNSLLDTIYKNHFRELIKPLEEITG
ncbi:MAG: DUF402 domain-containing protein [Lachnospiraceae bacterium]|nr:DUF402 domain-containing protein [Lachnospiraceae bacterium]